MKIQAGDKGGEPGQWSARKAQLAVLHYKKQGGGYEGGRAVQEKTHLHEWTQEDWGTQSGKRSKDSGERYLPREARGALSKEEYGRTTAIKAARYGQGQAVFGTTAGHRRQDRRQARPGDQGCIAARCGAP